MTEYGIFNDEGCIENGMYSLDEAKSVAAERYSDEPDTVIREMCPEHNEQPRDSCEDCYAE
jgi:hypothetical protein